MFPKTILETRQSIFSFKEIVMRADLLSALFIDEIVGQIYRPLCLGVVSRDI